MKVVVPFTNLHPVTKAVLAGYDVMYVPMNDDEDYSRLLRNLWQAREPFVLVEHDIAPWPGCVDELYACPADWCANSYTWKGGIGLSHMFGCAKFSTALMGALPDVWNTPCHWSECDQRLFFAAREKQIEPHLHRPPVLHLKGIAA